MRSRRPALVGLVLGGIGVAAIMALALRFGPALGFSLALAAPAVEPWIFRSGSRAPVRRHPARAVRRA
jgi:hypothetical protein